MDSTPNNGKLLFDVGGTFLKAVIADGNGRFVPDTEYSVPMPSDGPREEIEQALIAAVERGMRSAADRGGSDARESPSPARSTSDSAFR